MKVWRALAAFGAPLAELEVEDLTEPETFFIIGRAPNQIDIITTIDGIAFDAAWQNRVPATYGEVPVHYIGRDDLIANKEAADRPQDRADVDYLRRDEAHNGIVSLVSARRPPKRWSLSCRTRLCPILWW